MSAGRNPLSPRMLEVAEMIRAGNGDKEIAYRLGISIKTVSTYKCQMYQRMDVHSGAELVDRFYQLGIFKVDSREGPQISALVGYSQCRSDQTEYIRQQGHAGRA